MIPINITKNCIQTRLDFTPGLRTYLLCCVVLKFDVLSFILNMTLNLMYLIRSLEVLINPGLIDNYILYIVLGLLYEFKFRTFSISLRIIILSINNLNLIC